MQIDINTRKRLNKPAKFYEAAGRKVHLGGNIGAALLPMLPEVAPEDVAVVELSSFQLIRILKCVSYGFRNFFYMEILPYYLHGDIVLYIFCYELV